MEDLLVECDACLEPISDKDRSCASCGTSADGVSREGSVGASVGPYRAPPSNEGIRLLPFELARAPSRRELAVLDRAWRDAKAELVAPHDDEVELRATWLAAVVSAMHAERGDRLRERAVLETAWSRVALPIHRATIAARLARKAAREGALDRAASWIATITTATNAAEVDSDVDVARAVVAHERGEDEAALSLLDSVTGNARVLAAVVRLSILEQHDDRSAQKLELVATREHGRAPVARVAARLDLVRRAQPRATARTLVLAFMLALLSSIVLFVLGSSRGAP